MQIGKRAAVDNRIPRFKGQDFKPSIPSFLKQQTKTISAIVIIVDPERFLKLPRQSSLRNFPAWS
jgi:hypothetical protein